MDTARIAALLEPFLEQSLPQSQLDQISIYIDLLLRWNARINLTAIRNPDEIVTRHFGESLFLARHLFPTKTEVPGPFQIKEEVQSKFRLGGGARAIDIGSGAGFPALPLKIWDPSLDLTLIESNHKKAAFLNEAARELTFTNINVIADRAENITAHQDFPKADLVTFRAVEHFETVLQQAPLFLAPQGKLALLIGSAQAPLPTARSVVNVKWNNPIPIPQSHSRILLVGLVDKVGKNMR